MEISLANVRGIGYKKINNYFITDKDRFISALKNISFRCLGIKVSSFTFLNYWDELCSCNSELLTGIKEWVITSYPLVLNVDIDKQFKQKFARALDLFLDRYSTVSAFDKDVTEMIIDLCLKFPILVSTIYREKQYVDKALEEDLHIVGDFLNCIFNWSTLVRSETFLMNQGSSVYKVLCDLSLTDSKDFIDILLNSENK